MEIGPIIIKEMELLREAVAALFNVNKTEPAIIISLLFTNSEDLLYKFHLYMFSLV